MIIVKGQEGKTLYHGISAMSGHSDIQLFDSQEVGSYQELNLASILTSGFQPPGL